VAVALLGPGHEPEELDWASLTYADTAMVRAELAERLSPASVNQTLSAMRRVLKETWRLGMIDVEQYHRARDLDPVRGSSPPAGRAVRGDELRLLLEVCRADRRAVLGARDGAVIGLLFGGGLRRAEAAALSLADFDAGGGSLAVPGATAKGHRPRTVWLAPWAAEHLEAWTAVRGEVPGPLLLASDRYGHLLQRGIGGEQIRRLLARRAAEAGLGPVTPHDGRRTYISAMLEVTDLSTVSMAAGHRRVATTAGYDHRPADRAARAARRLTLAE
jgi:integrase